MKKRLVSIAVAGSLLGFFGSGFTAGAQACPASQWQPQPAGWHTADRTITDGQTTAGSPTLTSQAAQFNSYDEGQAVTGPNIPADTTIMQVQSPTEATLSANVTATGSQQSITIAGDGEWHNPSTALYTTPDGSTVVYQGPVQIGSGRQYWYGVHSSAAGGAGIDGYVEFNGYGNSDHPGGYPVVAGDTPVGSGGVMPYEVFRPANPTC